MKVVTRQNKDTGEMSVEYAFVANQQNFRFRLLKNIVGSMDTDITILIDTNQRIVKKSIEQLEAGLQQLNLRYKTMITQSNPRNIFGLRISISKAPMSEHKVILELSGNDFTRELYDTLKNYDIAFGFGRQKAFDEICGDYRLDSGQVLFNKAYFMETLYDSVVCECMRSSFHVEQFVRMVENENAV